MSESARQRQEKLLMPMGFNPEGDGVTNVLLNEHEKGFRNGLLFAINFPAMQVESDEQDVETLISVIKEKEDEDGGD